MSARVRNGLFLASAVTAAALLVASLVDLTRVDDFADLISVYYLDVGVAERRSYNLVSSVIFDYRGFDTMIEQLILFAAVVGATLLLRRQAGEEEAQPRGSLPGREVPPTSDAVRFAGMALAGFSVLVAVYIVFAVHITPGGGFQSGVLVAGGVLAVHIGDEFFVYERLTPATLVERVEAISAGVYVLVGVVGIATTGAFLANFLPLGSLGGLYGGGTIWLLNLIVGFEVTAGFIVLFTEYLAQGVLIRERSSR